MAVKYTIPVHEFGLACMLNFYSQRQCIRKEINESNRRKTFPTRIQLYVNMCNLSAVSNSERISGQYS